MAFEKTKNAYLMRLSELMKEQFKIQSFIVEHDHGSACLDVLFSGYVFRIHLACKDAQGKLILFTNAEGYTLTSSGVADSAEYIKSQGGGVTSSDVMLQEQICLYLRRSYEIAPLHHQMIHNYHSQNSSGIYSQSVRLFLY